MGKYLRTANGYDLFVVSSALQKSIRRNEVGLAGWSAAELFTSGFAGYAWRRILIISAEDCDGIITGEIEALHRAQTMIQEKSSKKKPCGFVFMAKAVLLLCGQPKNRDADHLGYLTKQKVLVSDEEVLAYMSTIVKEGITQIPEYVYDVHTREGRQRGKTKEQFWKDEQAGLSPKAPGLFDALIEGGIPSNALDDPQS